MLAVTGIGMVSSLGPGAVQASAAARAGILRITTLDGVVTWDEGNEELVPTPVHAVPGLADGLHGFARLLQLAWSAASDLETSGAGSPASPGGTLRTGLVLALPDRAEITAWLARVGENPDAAGYDVDLEMEEGHLARLRARLQGELVGALLPRLTTKIDPDSTRALLGDQVGFVSALEEGFRLLAERRCEVCWVGGVDSYLDPRTLEALLGLGLLRTAEAPAAPIPGEIGCILALEPMEAAKARGKPILAEIRGFSRTNGETIRFDPSQPSAEALLAAMDAADPGRTAGLRVVNLNGDPVRAMEWGRALVRLEAQGQGDGPPDWIPPLHFGEIGTGTGAASVALLAGGWARGYAPSTGALVCLMGNGPQRGAILVVSPDGGH